MAGDLIRNGIGGKAASQFQRLLFDPYYYFQAPSRTVVGVWATTLLDDVVDYLEDVESPKKHRSLLRIKLNPQGKLHLVKYFAWDCSSNTSSLFISSSLLSRQYVDSIEVAFLRLDGVGNIIPPDRWHSYHFST